MRAAAHRGGRAARAIVEAIDAFAAVPVRDEIIRRALAASGLADIPETPLELGALVRGPLRHAVVSLFDEATAEALVEALEPVVGLADAADAVRDPSYVPAADTSAERAILCVGLSPEEVEQARHHAGSAAEVRELSDHLLLAEAVAESSASEICVLVETRHVRPRAGRIGALARQLPSGARIVLWGATGDDTRLLALGHRELEWLPIGDGASLPEVISLCTVASVSGSRRRPVVVDRPVLVVEHDGGRRRALADRITSLGYSVQTATSGAEALAACAQRMPAVLVVEQMLPGMSGSEVARLLRSSAGEAAPPVVLLVSDVLEASETLGIAAAVPENVTEERLGPLLRKLAPRDGE